MNDRAAIAPLPPIPDAYGLLVMLELGPRWRPRLIDGSRRMLADRTPGRADLKIIERKTECAS
jgi:hypothetical protein